MKQYFGRVIGGTHKGSYHAVGTPVLKLPVPSKVSPDVPIYPEEIPDKFDTYTVATYKHVNMRWKNDEGQEWNFNFWVPVDVKYEQPYIMQTLLDFYVKGN